MLTSTKNMDLMFLILQKGKEEKKIHTMFDFGLVDLENVYA